MCDADKNKGNSIQGHFISSSVSFPRYEKETQKKSNKYVQNSSGSLVTSLGSWGAYIVL